MGKQTPIRVGVAGWDYPDWKGILYPAPRPRGFDPVRYLANYIDLIEINSTFYRPVAPHVAERWIERIEDLPHFRYTAKLYKRFTHKRGTAWTKDEVKETKAGLQLLNEAGVLDALLIQFPWSFKADEQNREWLTDLTNTFEAFPLVVEVRHESWNTPAFYEWLTERAIGFVNVDQPLFSKSIRPSSRSTSHVGYVRVHGRNYMEWFRKDAGRDARYDYLYPPEELAAWAERTKAIASDKTTETVDVVFNNHYKAQAVVNAVQFKSMLAEEPVSVPPILYESYPNELAPYAYPEDPRIEAAA
jgi:uncharacterized protein YecE (DUF72 family)